MLVYPSLLADANFHRLLLAIDRDIADCRRTAGGCACGGVLHAAHYPRKPRGQPAGLADPLYTIRFSFCCAVDGCRQRNTPPSVRFLGRKVWLAAIIVIISALGNNAGHAQRRLADHFQVSRRTVSRWRTWWTRIVPASPFWKTAAAAFLPPLETDRLPADLLARFAGTGQARLVALLCFLAPLTGGARCGHAF